MQTEEVVPIFRLKRIYVLLCLLFLCAWPLQASAHSVLLHAVPPANSQLDTSPPKVELTFNERMEKELFYIKVLDQRGNAVTSNKASISQDQTTISLNLPPLAPGIYTVSYKIISADGHPVGESYVTTIGSGDYGAGDVEDHSLHHGHGLTENFGWNEALLYSSRILFYISMLCLAGWIFWRMFIGRVTEALIKYNDQWSLILQRLFLVALLLWIGLQLQTLMDAWSIVDFISLFTGTVIGISWLILLGLSFSGFYILQRNKWSDALWLLALIAAKSVNGHAFAYDPFIRTVLLDFFHLFAAGVWVGGLLYIIVHWRKFEEHTLLFLPKFSRAALLSIIVLTITGTLSTLIFLPKLKYILFTDWGKLLLIKTFIVLLVIPVGAMMRRRLNNNQMSSFRKLLKLDFTLMLLIVGIVGVFTFQSPLPQNKPFDWHEMGEKVHVSVGISPNAPGKNRITSSVWLVDMIASPKYVELTLKNLDEKEMPPIDVPLVAVPSKIDQSLYPGFQVYMYAAEGNFLPFAGSWEIEVRVMDPNDDETVYHKQIMIY